MKELYNFFYIKYTKNIRIFMIQILNMNESIIF